jgi:hypothetical protein
MQYMYLVTFKKELRQKLGIDAMEDTNFAKNEKAKN